MEIKIKTKYDIGDIVYYIGYRNDIVKGEIRDINYYKHQYKQINYQIFCKDNTTCQCEDEIYNTEQECYDFMVEEFKKKIKIIK